MNMQTTDQNTEGVAPESQRDSQQRLDERACGTNTVQETKRWVVEGWHKLGFWTEYGETPQPENEAREHLAQCRGMLPQTAWRLVEAVERKTVIELLETSSIIDSSSPNQPRR